jgi:hypothetical protein
MDAIFKGRVKKPDGTVIDCGPKAQSPKPPISPTLSKVVGAKRKPAVFVGIQ